MSIKFQSPKDPDEILDYRVQWAARIPEGDEIASSTFVIVTPDSTVTINEEFVDGTDTIVWLGGGTEGVDCTILNRINTVMGRRMDQTVVVKIKSK